MKDLRNMESWEAVILAIEMSGMTRKEAAHTMGVSVGHINRYCSAGDPYEPSLDMIRRFCLVLGNAVLLRWVEAKLDTSDDHIPPPKSRAHVLTAIARASAALGDVSRAVADTEERGITPVDAKGMRSALIDVVGECRLAMGMLQHLAGHKDARDCAPLASLKEEPKPRHKSWLWNIIARG